MSLIVKTIGTTRKKKQTNCEHYYGGLIDGGNAV